MHHSETSFIFKYKVSFNKNQIGINQHLIITYKHREHLKISSNHLAKYKSFTHNHIEAHH